MTTATVTSPAPDLAEQVLKTLLRMRADTGVISNEDVRRAAVALGCSERRIRRMVARGYVTAPRKVWTPPEDLIVDLARNKGSIQGIYDKRRAADDAFDVSVRTVQRACARHYDRRVMKGIRRGFHAMDAALPSGTLGVGQRNDEWASDHTLLPVWVVFEDGTIDKPWMNTVMDSATRMIMSWTVTPFTPNTEDIVESLASAVQIRVGADGVEIGGMPRALRSDRGGDFVTRAVTIGLVTEGIDRVLTEAYTPRQNGRIEKWHDTIKRKFCVDLPGYDHSENEQRDPRKKVVPPPVEELLPFPVFQEMLTEQIRKYNTEHVHSVLGMTPYRAWYTDESPLRPADDGAIRAAMTQEFTRRVRAGRVTWDKRTYVLSNNALDGRDAEDDSNAVSDMGGLGIATRWLGRVEGHDVRVRYLKNQWEFVEVYTLDNHYVGRARWNIYLTDAEAGQARLDRRKAHKTFHAIEAARRAEDAECARQARQTRLDAQRTAAVTDDDVTFGPQVSRRRTGNKSAGAAQRKTADDKRNRDDLDAQSRVLAATGTDDDF